MTDQPPPAAPSGQDHPGAGHGETTAGSFRAGANRADSGPSDPPGRIFAIFLRLGLTSFGGPIAHLGYFRAEFVTRRGWLSDAAWADLVALCQFLPGPASSQAGFALGWLRAGWRGALAAFLGFTLPSALILTGLALGVGHIGGPLAEGALQGLKLVAVAIVAQAVLGMARSLCPDPGRATIAVAAVFVLALSAALPVMALAITGGALAGLWLGPGEDGARSGGPASPTSALQIAVAPGLAFAAALLFLLLLLLPLIAPPLSGLALFGTFAQSGALVFGGGHVVLPLLEAGLVQSGRVGADPFLAGYAAAQAVPGPLFTFAAWIGALAEPGPNGLAGAALALIAIFLPGFLILIAALPLWNRFRAQPRAQALMRGANAAVVGVLAAALYDPVFTGAVTGRMDFALALAGFLALTLWKAPPWTVVLAGALAGIVTSAA